MAAKIWVNNLFASYRDDLELPASASDSTRVSTESLDDSSLDNESPQWSTRGERESWQTLAGLTHSNPLNPQILLRLQLLSQELSNRLDQLCEDAVKGIPRVLHDLEFVSKDAQSLLSSVKSIQAELDKSDRSSSHEAFDNVVKLDIIRTRMESARNALKEAESWNSLGPEIEGLFAVNDVEKVGIRLEDASRSLHMLVGTPEYEERCNLLAKFRTQLDGVLKPRLVAGFQNRDNAEVSLCLKLFEKIQHRDKFSEYLFESVQTDVGDYWKRLNFLELQTDAIESYSKFFEYLTSVVQNDLSWCLQYFQNRHKICLDVSHHILSSLKPSLSMVLDDLVKKNPDQALSVITKAYIVSVTWSQKFEQFLSETATSSGEPTADEFKEGPSWGTSLFKPFISIQQNYGVLETNHLQKVINNTLPPTHTNRKLLNYTRIINEFLPFLFTQADAASGRCFLLTAGYGVVGLVSALDQYFQCIWERLEERLSGSVLGVGEAQPKTLKADAVDTDDDDDEFGYQKDDPMNGTFQLAKFQSGLNFLSVAKAGYEKLVEFEAVLASHLIALLQRIEENEEKEGQKLKETVPKRPTTKYKTVESVASLSTLRNSTLNGTRLRNLLASVNSRQQTASDNAESQQLPGLFQSEKALLKLADGAQRTVFDSIFDSVAIILSEAPAPDFWQDLDKRNTAQQGGSAVLDVPTFSVSPLPYVVKLGECLLTLPQRLEINFGNEGILSFRVERLPHITQQDLDDLFEGGGDSVGGGGMDDESMIHIWITSIARVCMERYESYIQQIPNPGSNCRQQIRSDTDYIIKVLDAMDVEPSEGLKGLLK
ncbi:hypothetical protein HDV05_008537 [Chytridiales sp. JEL 0842]|nr:hypothetical protein HDV05_008537 [Chytridiales sp. JEL 0842]